MYSPAAEPQEYTYDERSSTEQTENAFDTFGDIATARKMADIFGDEAIKLTQTTERSSVDAILYRGGNLYTYVLGNEAYRGKEETGKEAEISGHLIKLVGNQRNGQRIDPRFSPEARGPVIVTVPVEVREGVYRYFSMTLIPTSGETYNVIASQEVSNLGGSDIRIDLGQPEQANTGVSSIFLETVGRKMFIGIEHEVKNEFTVRGTYEEGDDKFEDIYTLIFGDDDEIMVDRYIPAGDVEVLPEERGIKIFEPTPISELRGLWTFTYRENQQLIVSEGIIILNDIERTGLKVDNSYYVGKDASLKPPIEGYVVRLSLLGNEIMISTYTRLDDHSRYAGVNPVNIFRRIMSENGIDLRSFFPDGCITSPLTYFFHIGSPDLIMNSRLNYKNLKECVIFSYVEAAWEYETIESEIVDELFGLGTPHYMKENHFEMIPEKFKPITYAANCQWPELCYQGPELRIPIITALTYGVMGELVTNPALGGKQFTDARLYPGEAVIAIIGRDIHPIKIVSPGYGYRSRVRGRNEYAFQALLSLMQDPANQIPISRELYRALLDEYKRGNAVAILPHYDYEVKMSQADILTKYIEYCVVMWLFSLPIHSQQIELDNRGGIIGIIDKVTEGINNLAYDLSRIHSGDFEDKHIKFLELVAKRLTAIDRRRGKKFNPRTTPSVTQIIEALIGKTDQFGNRHSLFNELKKYYFRYIKEEGRAEQPAPESHKSQRQQKRERQASRRSNNPRQGSRGQSSRKRNNPRGPVGLTEQSYFQV